MSDVLLSVKKMEESLKRLKQARKSSPATPGGSGSGSMSDDDKIRLQLALDVAHLGDQVTASEGPLGTPVGPEGPGRLFPRAGEGVGPKYLKSDLTESVGARC